MSATKTSACVSEPELVPNAQPEPGGSSSIVPWDDLSEWFSPLRPQHDIEAEQALADFEQRTFERTRPVTLARYVLRRRIGMGAHGVVYEAYDPQLDRKVAIKVLRGSTSSERHDRMLAEARSLARLVHPNVVTVHDVGVASSPEPSSPGANTNPAVFIVMELVPGGTLEQWLVPRRPWPQILGRLLEAGHGLQAAHSAGVVHRDFKPANVLRGDDGRVRVSDFGLALSTPGPDEHGPARNGFPAPAGGTPLYMSPELVATGRASPASDQYAFCVAAWEALLGHAPAPPGVPSGATRSRGDRSRIPRALSRALRRGLDPDPGQRWPSMERLLAALRAVPRRRRQRRIAAGLVVILGGTAAMVGAHGDRRSCASTVGVDDPPGAPERLHAITRAWSSRAAFERESLGRAIARVDAHRTGWSAAAAEVCAGVDEPTGDRLAALACLQQARDDLRASLDILALPEAIDPIDPIDVVAGLPAPGGCLEVDQSARQSLPPPGIQDEVTAARQTLATARARYRAGRLEGAAALARPVVAEAERLHYPLLGFEARFILAAVEQGTPGEVDKGVERARAVANEALESGHDEIGVRALVSAADSLPMINGRVQDSLELVQLAESIARRASLSPRVHEAIDHARISTLSLAHRYAEVIEDYERRRAALPPDDVFTHITAASAYSHLGRDDDADRTAQLGMDRARALFGPNHIHALTAQHGLANIRAKHDAQAASELHRDVLRRLDQGAGRRPALWFASTNDLANALISTRDFEEAEATFRALADAIVLRYGDDALEHALVLNNLARVLIKRGRHEEAIGVARGTLAVRERRLPPDHYHVGASASRLGWALVAGGHYEEAKPHLEHAVEIWRGISPTMPRLANPMQAIARAEIELGRPEAALGWVDRGLEVLGATGQAGRGLAHLHMLQARAHWDLGDEARARDIVREANLEHWGAKPVEPPLSSLVDGLLADGVLLGRGVQR